MTDIERLGRALAQAQDELPTRTDERAWVRARLLAAGVPQSPWKRRIKIGIPALMLALVVAGLAWRRSHEPPLTAAMGQSGLRASVDTWIQAPDSQSLPVVLSDGTRFEMGPKTRAKLLRLEAHDARVLLESGRAHVEVAHRPNQHFSIQSGPFVVRVTGTRFDVTWSPERDLFALVLTEGQVELAGCGFGAGRQLVAGQKVEASCRGSRVEVAYLTPTAAAPSGSPIANSQGDAPAHATSDSGVREHSVEVQRSRPGTDAPASEAVTERRHAAAAEGSSHPTWLKLAEGGMYAEAFAAADAEGFESACRRAPARELSLLAEAARHAGQVRKARLAFTILRQRFPAAKEAGLAAFSLGLLEFDGFADYPKAVDWFRTYLKERPDGPLVREARGRIMEGKRRVGDLSEAQNLASSYLHDYPSGPHAELARRILSTP